MCQQKIALLFILVMHTVAMGLPEVNTGRLFLRGQNSHFNKRLKGWTDGHLLSFVLQVFILCGFQQVSTAILYCLSSNSTCFCFLCVNVQEFYCCSTISNSSQKILPMQGLGWALMKNDLPNIPPLLKHSVLSISQCNYDVCFQFFYCHLMPACWLSCNTFKRNYFGRISCFVVIKMCPKWFSQGCLHGLRK